MWQKKLTRSKGVNKNWVRNFFVGNNDFWTEKNLCEKNMGATVMGDNCGGMDKGEYFRNTVSDQKFLVNTVLESRGGGVP